MSNYDQTIKIYDKQNKDQLNSTAEENEKFNLFKMEESDEESATEEMSDRELQGKWKEKAMKRQTLVLQVSDIDEGDDHIEKDVVEDTDYEKEEKKAFDGSGYMYKRKDGKQKWDRRYFRIIN